MFESVFYTVAPMVVLGGIAGPVALGLSICAGVQKYPEWRASKAALAAEEAAEVFAALPSHVVLTLPSSFSSRQTPFGGYERLNRSYPPFLCRFAVSSAAYERLSRS